MPWRTLLMGLSLLAPLTAQADRWKQHRGDCEEVFRAWRTQSTQRIRDCVITWEMYKDVSKVDADLRALVREPFDKLYQEGDKRDAVMALSALKKLGLRPSTLRAEAKPRDDTQRDGRVVGTAPPPRVVRPATEAAAPPPRQVDPREAKAAYGRGISYFKGGQFPEALSEFLISADSDPTYAQPLYMAAQTYMRLRKPVPAMKALQKMKATNSDLARQLVFRATTDPVFAPLRPTEAFKALTGLAVVQLLNGAGPKALKTIEGMAAKLRDAGMPVASISADRTRRQSTYIYAKPGYEPQSERIRRQLELGMVHKRPIDWPSEFDVIVVYGKAGSSDWVDDEAEKAGKGDLDEKKKEDDEARKAKEEAEKAKEEMKKKMEMIKMLQALDAEKSAEGATDDAKSVLPPP